MVNGLNSLEHPALRASIQCTLRTDCSSRTDHQALTILTNVCRAIWPHQFHEIETFFQPFPKFPRPTVGSYTKLLHQPEFAEERTSLFCLRDEAAGAHPGE
jgi:hypothetical protein